VALQDRVLRRYVVQVTLDSDGVLRFGARICVLSVRGSMNVILHEAYDFRYSIHMSTTKMYRDLTKHCWCSDMMRDIGGYVSCCLSYQ